jgi:hypothetical protein
VLGSDHDALEALFSVHVLPRFPHPRILDVTYGRGVIWRGLPWRPYRFDLNPDLDLDQVGDFRQIERCFAPGTWDVIPFDPPHAADVGNGLLARYGRGAHGTRGPNVNALFEPFLAGAHSVLVPGGLVLAKIADGVHQQHYQAQHVALITTAQRCGFELLEIAIVNHAGKRPIDPKWRQVLHLRNSHTYWLVLRRDRAAAENHTRLGGAT